MPCYCRRAVFGARQLVIETGQRLALVLVQSKQRNEPLEQTAVRLAFSESTLLGLVAYRPEQHTHFDCENRQCLSVSKRALERCHNSRENKYSVNRQILSQQTYPELNLLFLLGCCITNVKAG